ncbi:peptidylprolyl isomerase C [Hanseniaspora vineae]
MFASSIITKRAVPLTSRFFSSSSAVLGSKVFFDVSINSKKLDRIEFELYDDVTPKTCENFRLLCTGEKGWGYKGTPFHRIIPDFMIQGGDTDLTNGFGGKSALTGGKFNDENFVKGHNKVGLLSMANAGPNTNGSQFFITTNPDLSYLNGKHTVFGEVVKGWETVEAIEACGSMSGQPRAKVVIEESGEVKE